MWLAENLNWEGLIQEVSTAYCNAQNILKYFYVFSIANIDIYIRILK
jgi:hypothetical protein